MLLLIIGILSLCITMGPGDYISVKKNNDSIHRPEPGSNRK